MGASKLDIGLLPVKMQQIYLVLSLLSGIFLSPCQNSGFSEGLIYGEVFVCPRTRGPAAAQLQPLSLAFSELLL